MLAMYMSGHGILSTLKQLPNQSGPSLKVVRTISPSQNNSPIAGSHISLQTWKLHTAVREL